MQVMLMRLMSKGEYLIVPKGTKFMGSGKLGLIAHQEKKKSNFEFILRYNLIGVFIPGVLIVAYKPNPVHCWFGLLM